MSGWNRTGGCPSGFHPSGFHPGFHPVLVGVIRADEKPDGNRMDVRRTDIRLSGPIRTEPSGRMRENFIRPDGCPVFIRFFIRFFSELCSHTSPPPSGRTDGYPDIRPGTSPGRMSGYPSGHITRTDIRICSLEEHSARRAQLEGHDLSPHPHCPLRLAASELALPPAPLLQGPNHLRI